MKKKLIIVGSGDLAKLVAYYFQKQNQYVVCAFAVNKEYLNITDIEGIPVISLDEVFELYNYKEYEIFIAIGYKYLNSIRKNLFYEIKKRHYKFANYIHDTAIISDNVDIGENTLILENVILQPFTKIEDDTFIWCGVTVAHHTQIGKHCFLAPRVKISGKSIIKNECFLGIGAVVVDNITIGERSLIGAGSIITKDIGEKVIVKNPGSKIVCKEELSNYSRQIFYNE